ncbi:MAG: helix-turn-helix domain-containing protein [Theionarchaea archaeon]|nr:helix-turn-helix domain-containing protein [Theionarchaea archaeon]MBU7001525.1 helix-turn-helix domain-containing protein [Theionarchaea archaeon]MBU7019702.1 helix-turn-helix domain-containing protein [Theionarchaea archaeon]MBU7034413.1 helix-turn-helix domain-containing protein [Theionarchaea archaeon]MBU7041248.1 helix-turn-helix domain-containing protein [Theionarchaea archaeon]
MIDDYKERLAKRMAGEITLSEDPGKTMKKWREVFGITQTQLADHLNISSSVISDYEGGRRKSPGSSTIKKIVEGLIDLDELNGGHVIHAFSRMMDTELSTEVIIDMREFAVPINARMVQEAVQGDIIVNEQLMEREIFGYTVIDSIRCISEMTSDEFTKLYGWTTERALVFTQVSRGRSPMIAIRVKGLRPALIILHGPSTIDDPVAIRLAEVERIPLILSKADSVDTMIRGLRSLPM